MHEAKMANLPSVEIWGSGTPRREFLFTDDLADVCVHIVEKYSNTDLGELINIGVGTDISIKDLSILIAKIVGYEGELSFDSSKPDGTPRKLLDISRLKNIGWTPRHDLLQGITKTYEDFLGRYETGLII
jgi:GDP-L-fucose synthase